MSEPDKNVVNLINMAVEKCGSLSAVSRIAGINRGTLKYLKRGSSTKPHLLTISKLARVVYGK